MELLRRLREVGGRADVAVPLPASRRTLADLTAAAGRIRQRRELKEREEAERARRRRLEALGQREPEAWREVEMLVDQKTARAYDQAVALLSELRELAEYRGESARFDAQLAEIEPKYRSRPALYGRLRKAGLA